MKYFLTGATGFVGNHLAKLLIQKNHNVVAVVRNPSKTADLRNIGVQLVQGDVTDKESMRTAMEGCDGVFHVAGWYKLGAKEKDLAYAVNVMGSKNVFELMKELKIPKGVYTSTLAVNSDTRGALADEKYTFTGKHLSIYDQTKSEAHNIAHKMMQDGLPLVVVMPGIIYGIGDTSTLRKNIIDYLNGRLPIIPEITAYSWAHVEDIAMAHLLAMEKGHIGEDYIICGQKYTSVEAFKLISEISGKKMPIIAPVWMMKLSSVVASLFNWLPLPEMYTSEALRVLAGVTYLGDNTKAQKELGYHPREWKEAFAEVIKYEINHLA